MQRICLVVFFCLLLSGCAKLAHVDQLLTLKELADEQTHLDDYVDKQDDKFVKLLDAVKTKDIATYATKKDVQSDFGHPVYRKQINDKDGALDLWVYRYSVEFFESEKIHLYFDSSEHLLRWEHLSAQSIKK